MILNIPCSLFFNLTDTESIGSVRGKPDQVSCLIWAPHYTCNNSLRMQSITAALRHVSRWRKKKKKEVDPSPRVIVSQRNRWQIIGHSSIAIDESWNDLWPLQLKLGRSCDDDGALRSAKQKEEGRREVCREGRDWGSGQEKGVTRTSNTGGHTGHLPSAHFASAQIGRN